jgi:hypothetical protein
LKNLSVWKAKGKNLLPVLVFVNDRESAIKQKVVDLFRRELQNLS